MNRTIDPKPDRMTGFRLPDAMLETVDALCKKLDVSRSPAVPPISARFLREIRDTIVITKIALTKGLRSRALLQSYVAKLRFG